MNLPKEFSESIRITKNSVRAHKILDERKPTDCELADLWFSLTCRCDNPIPFFTGRGCKNCGGGLFSKVKEMACFCPYRTEDFQTLCENKRYPQLCKEKHCQGMMLSRKDAKHFLGVVDIFYEKYKSVSLLTSS